MNSPPRWFISLVLVCLVNLNESSATGFDDGLVCYWDFDGDLADLAEGLSRFSQVDDTGTMVNPKGVSFDEGGKFGEALQLDGESGYVEVKASADTLHEKENAVSISVWIRNLGAKVAWATVFSHGEGSQYRLALTNKQPFLTTSFGKFNNVIWDNTRHILDDRWSHVVCVAEKGVSTRLYLDGILRKTSGPPDLKDQGLVKGINPFFIGASPEFSADDPTNMRFWHGRIDDLAIWSRALSAEEIESLYAEGEGKSVKELITSSIPKRKKRYPVKLLVKDKLVNGPFVVDVTLGQWIRKFPIKAIQVDNGIILRASGSGHNFKLMVEPNESGPVNLHLKKGVIVDHFGGTNDAAKISGITFTGNKQAASVLESQGEILTRYPGGFSLMERPEIWSTEEIALILEASDPTEAHSPKIISAILADLNKMVTYLREVTGRSARLEKPYRNRIRMEFSGYLSKPVSKEGRLGFGLPYNIFEKIYDSHLIGNPAYPEEVIQVLVRNCWNPQINRRIGYQTVKGKRSSDWWRFAFTRLLATELTVSEGLLIEGAGLEERELWRKLHASYIHNERAKWFNTYINSAPEIANGEPLDLLLTGFLELLYQDYGKDEFLKKLFQEFPKTKAMKGAHSRSSARLNFCIAASKAAGKNLASRFNEEFKWPVSNSSVVAALEQE